MAKSRAKKVNKANNTDNADNAAAEGCPQVRWSIDMDWYERNNRSFLALVKERVCPKCRKQLKGEPEAEDLLATIKDCCADRPDYISAELPMLESIFRLVLANGNQPLTLEEIGRQLTERRGPDTYRTSAVFLSRLLSNDSYYGFKQTEA
ncbi:MAG: hypothetical protein Q8O05_04785 [Chloroflexota bacterium]|nr:hypothetical protein [Chloroflexota bacterium]